MEPMTSSRSRNEGAALLVALTLVIMGTLAVTAMICVMAARQQQAERTATAVQRRLSWLNTEAVNRQYGYVYGLRDTITRSATSASLATNWGGLSAAAYTSISAYETTQRPSAQVQTYPFNHVRIPPTTDGGYFYERTTADSNSNQMEHVTMFNYLKTYPAQLQGDLLILHKRAAASGDYYISDNLRVDGRVVIYDGTAQTGEIRANSYMHMSPSFTNPVKNNAGTATQLPENYAITPTATAGYGGSSTPTAVTNGTLKIINNTDFTPGSLYHLGQTTGGWETTYSSTGSDVGNTTSAVQIVKSTKVITVRLKHTGLTKHIRINAAFTELVLEGQTTAADFTNANALTPIIVWLESSSVLNVKITGENNRRLIFAAGPGAGANLNLNFQNSSIVSGSPLRWRMNLVSEYRNTYFSLPTSVNLQMTGGIRTNWALNCTDTGTTVRIILQRETSPGALETLLPRDGWMETYFLVR